MGRRSGDRHEVGGGGFTLALFLSLRDEMQAKISAEEGLENGRQIAADFRDQLQTAIKDRLAQFPALLRGFMANPGVADHTFKDAAHTAHDRPLLITRHRVEDIDSLPNFVVPVLSAKAAATDQTALQIGIGDDGGHDVFVPVEGLGV